MAARNPAASWIDVNKPVDLPVFTAAQLARDVYKKQNSHLAALKRRLSTRMIDSPEGAIWEEDLLQAEYELNPSYKAMVDRRDKMDEWIRQLEEKKAQAKTSFQRVRIEGKLRSLLSQRLTVARACRTMHDIAASAKADDEDRNKRIAEQQTIADKAEIALESEKSPVRRLKLQFKLATAKRARRVLEKERDWLLKKDRQLGIENMHNKIIQRALQIQKQRRFDKLERVNLTEDIAEAEKQLSGTQKILAAAWRLERAGVHKLRVPLMKKRDKATVFQTVLEAAANIDALETDIDAEERAAITKRQAKEAESIGADDLMREIHDELEGKPRRKVVQMRLQPGG